MTVGVFAQEISISGNVQDASLNESLPGVNVIVKNSANGATTNFDGNFKLTGVSVGDIITFSYLGFVTKEITITDNSFISINLQEDVSALDEVIVVGYGTQRKSNVTGSVASVEIDEAIAIPTTNVSEMLRGRAAGVQIDLGDARPGGNSSIRIRGNRSLQAGSQPFFVVDGLPFDNLNDIAPDDIVSVEVLKDAASTAIYGSRGANGVILITTKTGKAGKIAVDYHGYTTTQTLTRNFNQYTGSQFVDLRREANRIRSTGEYLNDENIFSPFELETIQNQNYVDWENLVLNDAVINSHSISVSAGSEKTKVFSSFNYFSQEGIIPNSGFERGTFKLNLDQQITEKLSAKAIINYQNSSQNRETGGLNFTTISPLAKPFNENDDILKFFLGPTDANNPNPLWNQRESSDQTKTNLTDINLSLTYDFTPSLSYTLKTFLRNRNTNGGVYRTSLHSFADEGINGQGFINNNLFKQVLVENILRYNPNIGEKHSLDFTAVQAFDSQRNEFTQIQKEGFTNDALGYNGNATVLLNDTRNVSQRKLLSYMGRLRYGLLDKYLFEFTTRADAASVFSENNKWGYFPAGSFAWKMHKESFMENLKNINELKLRISYGTSGNQAVPSLGSLGRSDNIPYAFGGQTVGGSTASSQLANPNLKWESTTTLNAGVDFRLFDNLFEGSFEYYNANTNDLILGRSTPGTSGFAFTLFNIGELENKGYEASLTTNLIRKKDLNWSVGMNLSSNKNTVLALTGELDDNGNPIDIAQQGGSRLSVGQSVNNIWLPEYGGIWQEGQDIANSGTPLANPGDIRVIDQDENGQIDERDNVFTNTDPEWYGSITNTFSYKGFELFADVYIVEGATRLNTVLADGELWKGSINGIRTKYYTPEFPSTSYPRPKPDTHVHLFSFAVRDASYVRLRTLSLGYNFRGEILSKIGLSKAKIYATGTNLFTFTDFKSYSPEQNPLNQGSTAFPETRNITLGIKLGF